MNDREKDEEIVVTYFTKQHRNVPRMTAVKHKKTENNLLPGLPNRGAGVTMFINPLKPELNPICYLLALLELTIFSTLAG